MPPATPVPSRTLGLLRLRLLFPAASDYIDVASPRHSFISAELSSVASAQTNLISGIRFTTITQTSLFRRRRRVICLAHEDLVVLLTRTSLYCSRGPRCTAHEDLVVLPPAILQEYPRTVGGSLFHSRVHGMRIKCQWF